MKPVKMFGLAVLAGLAAMAFAGTTSAMAFGTALCAEDEEPCALENTVFHVHETSALKAVLLSSVTVECDVLFLGDTSVALSSTGPVVIEGKFTYTNCGSCTVNEENGPAEVKVLKTGHETGEVTGEGLVKVVCSGFISCAYNGVGLKGTAKGPLFSKHILKTVDIVEDKDGTKLEVKLEVNLTPNGEVSLQGQTTNKEAGGFLCPATSKLDLVTTPLEATYISR